MSINNNENITAKYGQFYWCVGVTADVSDSREIYVMADDVEVDDKGNLSFLRFKKDKDTNSVRVQVNLAIAVGKWLYFFAASMLDGSPVACEKWPGQTE